EFVAVVAGTPEQVRYLDATFAIYQDRTSHAIVIGAGQVGRSCARSLRARGVPVFVIERDRGRADAMQELANKVVLGDASERQVLDEAGLDTAGAVVLTAADDAVNIYMAIYCRRLNRDLRVVSRVTHEKGLEAVYRAGANYVLSAHALGINSLISRLHDMDVM